MVDPMQRVYTVPPEQLQLEKRKLIAGAIALPIAVPAGFLLAMFCLRVNTGSMSADDYVRPLVGIGVLCAGLWVRALTLSSLRIELEDNRITRTQHRPFGLKPLRISFNRTDIAHIREIPKHGLIICVRNIQKRYVDLEIPKSIENYDDLRGHLASWQPIHDSWL
jgi:hypothetical protein